MRNDKRPEQLMRRLMARCSLFLLVCALVGLPAFADARRGTIRLTVGQSQSVRVPGTVTKVQVLNPSVADVATYSTRSATIVGVNGGSTELIVYTGRRKHKFTVVVTKVEVGRLFKQVRSYLGRIEGIFPRLIGDGVVISGSALTADDYGRAQAAVRLFGNKVRNLVRFKPSAVEQINQIFKASGLTDVRGRLISGTVFLEGSVGSKAEMHKVQAILRTYGLKVENLVKVGGGKQVLLEVEFVEMRKNGLQRVGVTWPSVLGVTGVTGQLQAQIPIKPRGGDTITMNLLGEVNAGRFALEALYSTGNARLLAQPKLVCGSGHKAEFLVGGEVPIVVITQNVVNIQYKEYGIKLKVTPTADSLGNVRAHIHAEVSELDQSVAVQNIPGFRTRKFKTFVTVKDGASIVLSGLFSNTEQKSVSKLPLLGHIPIIGELFKSREFRDQKTTLVVFVTPRVVAPDHPWVRKQIGDIQRLYSDYKDEVGWQVFD
ncbi:MAG: secretin [Deltaproteobacteria bacterium]|nr:MAG: secretin [Pseudomonadota bacterium]PIE65949.1 MAG: secretin [Deltaproteobacteria bacterium]